MMMKQNTFAALQLFSYIASMIKALSDESTVSISFSNSGYDINYMKWTALSNSCMYGK